MFYVVSYDISDDTRRNRTAKTLLDFGTRVQYSVFECILDDELLEDMVSRLARLITDEDSVRIYTMCAKCEKAARVFGTGEITKDENVYIL